mgnify:CR=1 FL=1
MIYIRKKPILDWLSNLPAISDEEAYRMSNIVEPKKLEYEKSIGKRILIERLRVDKLLFLVVVLVV